MEEEEEERWEEDSDEYGQWSLTQNSYFRGFSSHKKTSLESMKKRMEKFGHKK